MIISNEEEFLNQREINEHKRDLTVKNINKKLNYLLGSTVTKPLHALSQTNKPFREDFSELDLQNKGAVFKKSTILAAIYAGGSLKTGIWGLETDAVVDFSKDSLLKAMNQFKGDIDDKSSVFYQNFTEVSTYISENVLTNPEMAATFLSYSMQVASVALGIYVVNELKKRKSVDAFVNSIDNNSDKDHRLSNASLVFQNIDNFYTLRRLNVIVGDGITDFIKDISNVIAEAIKNNVTNPILDKAKDIIGDSKYNTMRDFIKDNISEPINNKVFEPIVKFFKRKHTNSSDVIRMMENKYKASELSKLITHSSEINISQEVSKIAEDVYFSVQKTQLKKLISDSIKNIRDSQEALDLLGTSSLSFLHNRKVKKENNKINKSIEVLKEIEYLSTKDHKKEALSKYTVLSEVANDFLNKLDSGNNSQFNGVDIDSLVNHSIEEKQIDIQKTYLSLNQTKYSPFIEKMLIPEEKSIGELFNQKIDEFIEGKKEDILNKKINISSKLQSNLP